MFKTKQILIALAVAGVNVLHNVPIHQVQAATVFKTSDIVVGQKINFGSYWQSKNANWTDTNCDQQSSYNKDAITWRVLANNSGKLTLLSDKSLFGYVFKYEPDNYPDYHNLYVYDDAGTEVSADIRTVLLEQFMPEAFTSAEQAMLAGHECVGETNSKSLTGKTVTDKIYLLSKGELETYFPTATDRIDTYTDFACYVYKYGGHYTYNGEWLLRSPSTEEEIYDLRVSTLNNGEFVSDHWTDAASSIRPAIDLDLSHIIFGTEMNNGKLRATAGGCVKFGEISSTSNLDLWLDDTVSVNRVTSNVTVGDIMKLDGSKVSLAYTGAKGGGNGEYVSALFFNESGYTYNAMASQLSTGDLVGYGKGDAEATSASGTTKVDIGALDAGSYKVEIFNENGMLIGERAEVKGTLTVDSSKNLTYTIKGTETWKDITIGTNNKLEVASGGDLTVTGVLDISASNNFITADKINFKSGSTLKVDGSKITSTPAISGLTSASVESGSKLYVANAEKETEYKILAGSGLNVQSWQTDETATGINASYGLKVDTENITNNGTEFNIKFTEDTKATGSSDIGNILANLPADSEAKAWVDEISASQGDAETLGNTVNTMVNSAQLANVQTGTSAINNLTNENICINTGVMVRPMVRVGTSATLRNTSAKKSSYEIATIPLASKENMELHQENSKQVYSKEIWASYIHSKQKVDGMETGHLQQNSNIQYNGVTVGTDLWSGRHGFGGVALTYADGNVNSTQKVSSVKNETDYYGLTVYNRQDVGKFSFQYDGGITHSKNDVTMSTQGAEDVTANPKVNIYNIGGRVENSYKLSEKTEVVPFAGLRYTFVKTKEYHNSLGMGFDVDDQHMWNVPVGVAFRSNFGDVDGWLMGSTLEAGYAWNLGDRDSEQRITYGNTYDVVGFNTADKGQYFIKGALQAKRKNLSGEVGYRYSKGDTVRDSRWNFNVGVSF